MIEIGIIGEGETAVTDKNTAESMASGALPVFATPAMIFLIEKTAAESVHRILPSGKSTVGTLLNVKHTAPSPIGSKIYCRTELVEIDRSRMVFSVKVWDEAGETGSGIHERFIVDNEDFLKKADSRLGRQEHLQ